MSGIIDPRKEPWRLGGSAVDPMLDPSQPTYKALHPELEEPEILLLEPREQFDPCIRGIAQRFNSRFLVYDRECVLEALRDPEDEDPETSALEHYEFNIVGGWVGEGTPAFLEPFDE